MTFRTKVLGFSLAIGILAVALAALVGGTVHLIVRDNDRLSQILQFDADVRSAESLASEILLDGGERPHRQWRRLSESLHRDLLKLDGLPSATPGLLAELASRVQNMDRAFGRLSALAAEDSALTRSILAQRIRANKDALVSRVAALEGEVRATQVRNYRLVVIANMVVIGCLLMLAVTHQFIMRRFLSGAWYDLEFAIHRIAIGDLSDRIVSGRRDEIGQMLSTLDGMREKLHAKIQVEDAARRTAEELSRAKSRFITSVSHELRTPLTGLLGLIDLADRRPTFGEIKRDLKGARSAGQHLLELINQILDFSKIEADKIDLSCESFSPDAVLKAVESIFAAQATEKGIVLELVAPLPPTPRLMGDPHRLSQVLFNLVGNAIKFTDTGKVTVAYSVTPAGPDRYRLHVDVVDTGPGIPAEANELVFDDFSQLSTPGKTGKVGTGLGLAISARLARLMGGRIGLDPDSSGGAHFFVTVDMPAAPALAAIAPETVTPQPVGPLRILVADDIGTNRMIVREMLTMHGHHVEEAENGLECLRMLGDDTAFDAVLMDVNMPVMDGIEATRTVRASSAPWHGIPIIGLSANAFQEQVDGYLESGMTACIAKPVVWQELLSTLAKVTGAGADNGAPAAVAAERPVEAIPDERPLLDEDRFAELLHTLGHERFGGLINRSRELFLQGAREAAAQVADPRRLEATLHGLRGAAGNLGCVGLASEAFALEQQCRNGAIDHAAVSGLPRLAEVTVAAADRWIERRMVA